MVCNSCEKYLIQEVGFGAAWQILLLESKIKYADSVTVKLKEPHEPLS